MLTFSDKKLSTGANRQNEDAAAFQVFCPRRGSFLLFSAHFDCSSVVLSMTGVAGASETRVRILPWESSGHVTIQSMSPQHLRSHYANLLYQEALDWRKWTK